MIPGIPDRLERSRRYSIAVAAALCAAAMFCGGCTFTNGVARGISDAVLSRQKRETYHFQPDFTVSDPQFRRALDSLADPMIGGNSASLLENGDEIFPAMTGDIRSATTSVNLETFIFRDDAAGRQFADALIAAARRGVEVRLLVDGWGSHLGKLEKEMTEAGVICRVYRPLHFWSINRPGIRTHRKLLIVDGRIGYTGGLGIDKRWLGDARNSKEWRDTQVRVTGPVVVQMQAIFSENWTYTTGEILAGDSIYPPLAPTGTILAQAIKASRSDSSSLPKMMYFMAIKAATRSIHISNPYFIPDAQVRAILVDAVRRGVDVEILVPGARIDMPLVRQASGFYYGELLEGGVAIYEYQPTMIHQKTMVVDGIFSTIGSINFDQRSMGVNAEESLSFYDAGFAAEMEAMFERDLAHAHRITYAEWKHRGAGKRFAEMFSWIWEPYY